MYSFPELTDISADFLDSIGVKFLMLDLDNTIAAYSEHQPSEKISLWVETMKAHGLELFIISNSLRKKRIRKFAKILDVNVIMNAHKPSPKGAFQAMSSSGYSVKVSALVGDQIFTDVLAANRAGVISIIVKPRRFTNPVLALRYAIEYPFRAICKNIFTSNPSRHSQECPSKAKTINRSKV